MRRRESGQQGKLRFSPCGEGELAPALPCRHSSTMQVEVLHIGNEREPVVVMDGFTEGSSEIFEEIH